MTRNALCAIAALATLLFAVTLPAAAAGAKKGGTLNAGLFPNQVVPAATPGPPFIPGSATSTMTAGKKLKGKRIADVNVNVQVTASGAGSEIGPLSARLTAPDGTTVGLFFSIFGFGLPGTSLGPLTFDDETPVGLNSSPSLLQDPDLLNPPYVGKARPSGRLLEMDGGPAGGNWSLRVTNEDDDPAHVHTFVSWGVQVKTRPPFATK